VGAVKFIGFYADSGNVSVKVEQCRHKDKSERHGDNQFEKGETSL
jgi:hypothetical protein